MPAVDGAVNHRIESMPQGRPLSLLLPNIVIDGLGRELERHVHCFVHYICDVIVLLGSERSARWVHAKPGYVYGR